MERESKAGRRLERYRRGRDFLKIEEAKKGVFDDVISELTILSGLYSDILDTYSEDEWWTIFVVLEELQGEILGYIKVDDGVRDRLEGYSGWYSCAGEIFPYGVKWIDEIMEHLYSIREKFDQVVYELDNVIDRGEKGKDTWQERQEIEEYMDAVEYRWEVINGLAKAGRHLKV